jgi:hypothetical protein
MKKIITFVGLLITFVSSLIIFVISVISFFIDDFYSTKVYHHNLLSIMILTISFYSAVKSLKSLNKDLEANF